MWAERLEVGENMLKNPHELAIGEVESKKGRNWQLFFKFREWIWSYQEIPKKQIFEEVSLKEWLETEAWKVKRECTRKFVEAVA